MNVFKTLKPLNLYGVRGKQGLGQSKREKKLWKDNWEGKEVNIKATY